MFDLINAVSVTAIAFVLILVLSTSFGTTPRTRATIAAALGVWFVLLVAAGATGVLDARRGIGIFGFSLAVAVPIAVLATLILGTRAGRARVAAASLPILIASQAMRVTGICFVLLYAAQRLPAPFAPTAGWGDIIVGGLAPLVALMALRVPVSTRVPILAWNTLGFLDLVAAIVLGTASAPGPTQIFTAGPDTQIMTSLPWIFIPCFLVPVNFSVHLMIFAKLRSQPAAISEALAAS